MLNRKWPNIFCFFWQVGWIFPQDLTEIESRNNEFLKKRLSWIKHCSLFFFWDFMQSLFILEGNIHFINKSDKKYWTWGEPLLRQTKKNFEDTDKPTCLLFESQSGSKPNQTPALCWLYLSYLFCFPPTTPLPCSWHPLFPRFTSPYRSPFKNSWHAQLPHTQQASLIEPP